MRGAYTIPLRLSKSCGQQTYWVTDAIACGNDRQDTATRSWGHTKQDKLSAACVVDVGTGQMCEGVATARARVGVTMVDILELALTSRGHPGSKRQAS